MHFLQRPADAPAELERLQNERPYGPWDASIPRQEIKVALQVMQGSHCAYCERTVGSDGHIEHFRRRADHPELTFDWHNLFYSCSNPNSCGKFKDLRAKRPVPYLNLIDPCHDDPEDYFDFLSDGNIVPKANLSSSQKQKALTTIATFNLQSLRHEREQYIAAWIGLMGNQEALRASLERMKASSFSTALFHLFGMRRSM
jgi:uncharacterized protein (TIGR02646 family)